MNPDSSLLFLCAQWLIILPGPAPNKSLFSGKFVSLFLNKDYMYCLCTVYPPEYMWMLGHYRWPSPPIISTFCTQQFSTTLSLLVTYSVKENDNYWSMWLFYLYLGGSLDMFGCIPEPVLGRIAVSVSVQHWQTVLYWCSIASSIFYCCHWRVGLNMKELLDQGQSQSS